MIAVVMNRRFAFRLVMVAMRFGGEQSVVWVFRMLCGEVELVRQPGDEQDVAGYTQ